MNRLTLGRGHSLSFNKWLKQKFKRSSIVIVIFVLQFKLNDSHYMAYVHYNRETIVVLTRDRIPRLHSNSHVWISKNYGHSFQNRSSSFTLWNGSSALINMFYASPVDDSKVSKSYSARTLYSIFASSCICCRLKLNSG